MSAADEHDSAPRPVFDRDGLLERVMGDEELADEIAQDFLSETPSHIEVFASRVSAADADGAGRQAHFIKGAAATVGAGRIWALALELESAGKAGDMAALESGPRRLSDELARLRNEIAGEA